MSDMKCIYCGQNTLESCYAVMGAKAEASYDGKTEYFQCLHCHAFVSPQDIAELQNHSEREQRKVPQYTIASLGRSLDKLIEQGQEYMDDKRWQDGLRLWDTAINEYGSDPLLIAYRSCCLAMIMANVPFDDQVYAAICVVKQNANYLLNGLREDEIVPRHNPREVVYYLHGVSAHYLQVTQKISKTASPNGEVTSGATGAESFLQRPQVLDKMRHTLRDIAVTAKAIQALYTKDSDDDTISSEAIAAAKNEEKIKEHLQQQLDSVMLPPLKKNRIKKIAIIIIAILLIILGAGITQFVKTM